jgi:hypothetical protein
MGERCRQIERPPGGGHTHFGFESADQALSFSLGHRRFGLRHQLGSRRKAGYMTLNQSSSA